MVQLYTWQKVNGYAVGGGLVVDSQSLQSFIHSLCCYDVLYRHRNRPGITELLKQKHFILFKVKVNHINWSWCCCHISDIECHIHMFCLGKIGQEWVSVGDEVVRARFNSSFGLSGWKEYCILFSILSSSEMQKSCLLKNRSDWRFDKVEINWIFSPKFIINY